MKLYHYTTIESFAKIWVSKQLRFSESKNTNDLFERRKTWELACGILPKEEDSKNLLDVINSFGRCFSEILSQYKQISFTLDYKNIRGCKSSMMWGQYAHNDNGVCIELDSDKLIIPTDVYKSKVRYTYDVPKIRFDKENEYLKDTYLQQFVKRNRKTIFFSKHKHWEHENEYRLVSKCHDYLSIEGAITRVYVYDSTSMNTRVVEHIINKDVPIYFLYISNLNGKRDIGCDSLEREREYERKMKEEPDYYTNQKKVIKRAKEIFDKIGLPLEVNCEE